MVLNNFSSALVYSYKINQYCHIKFFKWKQENQVMHLSMIMKQFPIWEHRVATELSDCLHVKFIQMHFNFFAYTNNYRIGILENFQNYQMQMTDKNISPVRCSNSN